MTEPRTLNELFLAAMDHYRDRPVAMRAKSVGRWIELSFRDVLERVRALSTGLSELGVAPGDRLAILSENRPEWAIADYAVLAARCIDVPIYPTLPARQIEYILRDSGAVLVFASTEAQLAKVLEIRAGLPELRFVVAFDADARAAGVLSLEEVYSRGRAAADRFEEWRARALDVSADDVATVIYTSGTTGDPKGVMLTHGNITSNVVAALTVMRVGPEDECLSFLPLSHIFERTGGHYAMMHSGVVVNYAESIDTVSADMQARQPTCMLSVPRLYEKIYARVLDAALSGSAIKKRIFFWAKRTGERWTEYALAGRPLPRGLATRQRIADRLVFSKLRARTGGRLRFFVSGGAPLSADIAKFFYAAGMPIMEGYGLTETSPVITLNGFEHVKLGAVGRPIPGVQIQIAADGEILTRGPHVMKGYYGKPDATAEVIDPDGWFHTGDIGVIDAEGFLKITDRKKDIIVTAGGKNIAPQPIEGLARTNKFVSNAVMLGDRRKFPIMLVVPNMDTLKAWATREGLAFTDDASLIARDDVMRKMEEEVERALSDRAHFERPKRLLLVGQDFSIEGGELTPTLKVRRRVVERNHQARIDAIYANADTATYGVEYL